MSGPEPAQTGTTRHGLEFNRWLVGFAVIAIPLMIALGFWQLARADQKANALAAAAERDQLGPLSLVQLQGLAESDRDRIRVTLVGEYLGGRDFLLDNRIHKGRVGYELLSPFRDDSGAVALVNRGWVQAPSTRDRLPAPESVTGRVTVETIARVSKTDRRNLELFASPGWPSRVQAIDLPAMAEQAGLNLHPNILLIQPEQPGALVADWPVVNMPPDKHLAYAAQWFLMAVALFLVTMFGGTNMWDWIKERRTNEHS